LFNETDGRGAAQLLRVLRADVFRQQLPCHRGSSVKEPRMLLNGAACRVRVDGTRSDMEGEAKPVTDTSILALLRERAERQLNAASSDSSRLGVPA
jgi:hypothetical protein